ncbi:hypothetical protein [Parapedobacter lycopersici]|uniref:hypothetical protein n=1 Tax=Parapedobacter lycopersici TaxID=1864939 RepID=UPI00214DA5E0|nr:hypothetical protein [Parapedobacter lycopersici]
MTFEEFFIKKKIDLAQLRRAQPDLYGEFREHYVKMGEKSFDHTKKYWFNRLRKDYLLPEIAAATDAEPVVAAAPAVKSEKALPPGTVAAKPVGFKPRFKAGAVPPPNTGTPTADTATPSPAKDAPGTTDAPAKPMGFKPRFKPGTTPVAKPEEPKPEATAETQTPTSEASETPEAPTKPLGFKPRFKAGVTPAAKPEEPTAETAATPVASNPTEKTAAPAKPLGFKPRFKAGVTPTAKPEEPEAAPKQQEEDQQKETTKEKPATPEDSEQPAKPLGFKPRFKAGITRPGKDRKG